MDLSVNEHCIVETQHEYQKEQQKLRVKNSLVVRGLKTNGSWLTAYFPLGFGMFCLRSHGFGPIRLVSDISVSSCKISSKTSVKLCVFPFLSNGWSYIGSGVKIGLSSSLDDASSNASYFWFLWHQSNTVSRLFPIWVWITEIEIVGSW